ncbi:hypothetical protein B0H13DRAFT_1618612, partial [Mycena leptocephala]
LEQLRLAASGKYIPKNFTQYEIDLAILLFELGGGGAVYAMNHSIFALPSLNTIQPYRRQHWLIPSVSGLKITDITANIAALFGPHSSRDNDEETSPTVPDSPPIFYAHTLAFDEIATERKIDYIADTDEMGGLRVEHLSTLETVKVGKDMSTVEAAVAAVREEIVHIAHETSVGAIIRLSETHYGAKPVYMAPTCKKGTWQDQVRSMSTVIEAWRRSPHGESKHGPIVSFSSDGYPKRWAALFAMCMHTEIVPGNPLYP